MSQYMKIITNTDINALLIFAKLNLGMYKLVYKKCKTIYWSMVLSTVLCFAFLVLYALASAGKNKYFTSVLFLGCVGSALFVLYMTKKLDELTKDSHLQVQNKRFEILKKYYNEKEYRTVEISIINEQLSKRLDKINRQKTTIIVILGIMILPIWETVVNVSLSELTAERLVRTLFIALVLTIFLTIIIKLLNRSIYLYEENIYIKNNTFIIENLIFLNNYIILEEKENGRRK